MISAAGMLSVFIREPEFVGQTKDRLASVEAIRIVENAIRDPFDHWLADNPQEASKLLEWVIARADERVRRRQEKEVVAQDARCASCACPASSPTARRMPPRAPSSSSSRATSAGGSAKQARDRASQAVLPLRGKILNVASAGNDKLAANQQISDLIQALGCGTRSKYRDEDLRYDRVIIMTDADVDGAHIASLLITFFYQEMPNLVRGGHLYLAVPPLYSHPARRQGRLCPRRRAQGRAAAHRIHRPRQGRDRPLQGPGRDDGRAAQGNHHGPEEAHAAPGRCDRRSMPRRPRTAVDALMGTKPEARFRFIQERAEFAATEVLDI